MPKSFKTPLQALNNTFRRMPVVIEDVNFFVKHISDFIGNINEKESEEFAKGQLTQFLYDAFYHSKNKINTKGRIDLAIYDDKTPIVIIECKRPKPNDSDMISLVNLNAKAFHELILYYLRERIEHNNTNIKHLIATNMYEWFVFDERDFDKLIFGNASLKKDYETFARENKNTDHFYKSIAKIFLEKENPQFEFTHFDLRTYKKLLVSSEKGKTDEEKENRGILRALYKFLSPQHLLKQQLENDSNSLNKDFYYELLHIIGLEEVKDNGKKIIQRKPKDKRDEGSLLENLIFNIEQTERLRKLQNPSSFGDTPTEQLFSVALELCISWVDRILFLKLLEQQLVRYNKSNDYLFLNIKKIPDFDALRHVFFSVLAKKTDDRQGKWKTVFEKTPYLNSSLFEPNSLEDDVIGIESLDSHLELEIFKGTKILVGNKPAKGNIPTLEYLFKFLDAYNFASEGADEEQEDRKALINAAVLGLIFEKINGYKDGSFFTPGFITMYMCRETLRKTVLDKFNEKYKWKCEAIEDLYNHLKRNTKDILEYNEIINDLKICDPAVGSGHFLVSALNELIAIKNELGILADCTGKTLPIKVTVENDELMVIYGEQIYDYSTPTSKSSESEIQRIQKALFHEKELIIEHCLFGVDINGNSVKICRLRLWIELLKNAYYTKESNYQELETLPNIDINIKRGNSLMSRFALNSDLSTVFKQQRFNYNTYRLAVESYKTAPSKKAKQDLLIFINEIKEQFKTVFLSFDPLQKKLNLFQGQRLLLNEKMDLFGKKIQNEKEVETEKKRLDILIRQTEEKIKDKKDNKVFRNAFEWRFEFPEVMDKNGGFIGFDLVIGNPPYLSSKDFDKSFISYLSENYVTSQYQLDLYVAFIEKGISILKPNGLISFITPNSWLKNMLFTNCRKYLLDNAFLEVLFPNLENVFEEASVDSLIFVARKGVKLNDLGVYSFIEGNPYLKHTINQSRFLDNERYVFDAETNPVISRILDKVRKKSIPLSEISDITRGVNPYDKARGQSEETIKSKAYHSTNKKDKTFLPEIRGKHVNGYSYSWDGKHYISYGEWLAAPREMKYFKGERLIMRQVLGEKLNCTIIKEDFIIDQSVFIAKLNSENKTYINAVQGILASTLISKYFRFSSNEFDALFPKIKIGEFRELPVYNDLKEADKVLSKLVVTVLEKKKIDPKADTNDLEKQIDKLVYKLFDLSDKEIKIIEQSENA